MSGLVGKVQVHVIHTQCGQQIHEGRDVPAGGFSPLPAHARQMGVLRDQLFRPAFLRFEAGLHLLADHLGWGVQHRSLQPLSRG